jgi:hypothetical protein
MVYVRRFLVRSSQSKNIASSIMIGKLRTGRNGWKPGLKHSSRDITKGALIYTDGS